MILLTGSAVIPGRWDIIDAFTKDQIQFDSNVPRLIQGFSKDFTAPDVKNIDAAIKQVLRKFAIDPDKIALGGMSDGGSYSLFLGRGNLDVFSRIAPLSPGIRFVTIGPQHPATQFFLLGGILEPESLWIVMTVAQQLQDSGHAVERVLALRGHAKSRADDGFMWKWFNESWAGRSIAPQATPPAGADSAPVLTTDMLTQMTTFWSRFMQEPDSIRTTGREAHQKQVAVAIGPRRVWVLMANIPALATKYPSVAADLKAAGLTAQQAETYRIALISAQATRVVNPAKFLSQPSVLASNVTFLQAHPQAFANEDMWSTP